MKKSKILTVKNIEANPFYPKKEETIEERRDKGLKEIFNQYARSQMLIGKKATFEQIEHELSNLNLGEYMKFVKDFNIPCSKTKTAEVFKKIATNSKELYFEDFKNTLWKLFEMRDNEEIDKLKKRLREIKKIQKKNKEDEKQTTENKPVTEDKKEDNEVKPIDDKKDADEAKQSTEQAKTEQDNVENIQPSEPQTTQIARPKGGDPKNVETLQNIQAERKQSQQELGNSTSQQEDSKVSQDPKADADNEINKKVEFKDGEGEQNEKDPEKDQEKQETEPVDELEQEKQRILKRMEELKANDQDFYQEQIMKYIECDNPKSYKIKSKGKLYRL